MHVRDKKNCPVCHPNLGSVTKNSLGASPILFLLNSYGSPFSATFEQLLKIRAVVLTHLYFRGSAKSLTTANLHKIL